MMTKTILLTRAWRPTAPRHSGDLCPSRARPQAAGPPSGRTRAVGQIGPPAFLMPSLPHRQARTAGAARPADDTVGQDPRLSSFPAPSTSAPNPGASSDRHLGPTTEERLDEHTGPAARGAAGSRPTTCRSAGAPHRGRQQAVRGRPEEEAGDGDLARVDAPRARRRPRDPRFQRLRQVDAHPAHLRTADPRRGSGRGLRPRHRPRGDGGQAADQPGQRGRRLLQEAQPDGEPPLRGPPVRPRWHDGEARSDRRSWLDWASRRSGSTDRSSR